MTFLTPCLLIALPGSWKGTRAKLYKGLFGLLRDVSRILEAPSMTWTKSSYMEPVTSNTKASVDAPSGTSSVVAPVLVSCSAENAADSTSDSHISLEPISDPRVFSDRDLGYAVLASGNLRVLLGLSAKTWEQFMKCSASAKQGGK